MNRDELKQLIQGPIAAVSTAFDDQFMLDLPVMEDLTEWWVDNGLVTGKTVLKVAAAIGEGPDLTDEEWPRLLRTVVSAARHRVPVVCGLKPKDTLHTIDDVRKAHDLGAVAVQIDLPFFHHPTQDDIVRFYTDISDATDIGILIYNTHWFGAPSMTAESLIRLIDAEHVVGIKWDVPDGQDYDEMRKFAGSFNVIDNSLQPVRCHQNGGRGYINWTVDVYPPYELRVWELLEAGCYGEAQNMLDNLYKPLQALAAKVGRRSGGYSLHKSLMAIMGRPVGPPRPPTLPLNSEHLGELREILAGLEWPVADVSA
jgi:4-hydroxy-tetrahydrodipicolinate synthase